MNLIENACELTESENQIEQTINETKVLGRITEVWNHHPRIQENIWSRIKTMSPHIVALIKAESGSTKYKIFLIDYM